MQLVWSGMTREKICFPVHRGFGFRMAGCGILPSQVGTHMSSFITSVWNTGGGRERGREREGEGERGGIIQIDRRITLSLSDLLDEHVSLGHHAAGGEGVLHDTHHGSVALRGHDVPRNHQQLLNLRLRLEALGHVQVHLVPVKVSVVGSGHTVR